MANKIVPMKIFSKSIAYILFVLAVATPLRTELAAVPAGNQITIPVRRPAHILNRQVETAQNTRQDPSKLGLHYDVYAGGLKALHAELEMDMKKIGYDLKLTAETQGFIGALFPWKADYATSGKRRKDRLVPNMHRASSSWRDKVKVTEMAFNRKGHAYKATIKNTNGKTATRKIRESLAGDAVDMLSGAIMLFQNTKDAEKCEGGYPVFDGKRRFKIVLSKGKKDVLRKSRYSAFSGEALKCIVRVEPLAGFKRIDSKRGWMLVQSHTEERKKPPTIWLAKIDEDGPVIPVRMEIRSDYGSVVAHLTAKQ